MVHQSLLWSGFCIWVYRVLSYMSTVTAWTSVVAFLNAETNIVRSLSVLHMSGILIWKTTLMNSSPCEILTRRGWMILQGASVVPTSRVPPRNWLAPHLTIMDIVDHRLNSISLRRPRMDLSFGHPLSSMQIRCLGTNHLLSIQNGKTDGPILRKTY